jgi:hypothetical protein
LSFELLEHPVRASLRLDRHRVLVIGTSLAVSVVSALVLIPKIVAPPDAGGRELRSATTTGFTPVPADLDWQHAEDGGAPLTDCYGKPASACTVVRGDGPHVLLIGDSHAWMLIPAFEAIARRDDLTLSVSVTTSCPWQRGLYPTPITVNGVTVNTKACETHKEDLYERVIPSLDPDVIVTMEVGHEDRDVTQFLGPDQETLPDRSPEYLDWIEKSTTDSFDALRADGRKVLLIDPIPVAPSDPLACLSKAKVLEECRYVATHNADHMERLYRELADRDDQARPLDLDRLVCPYLPICDPVVNRQIVKFDTSHLTPKFVTSIAPAIDAYLKDNGLISR